MTQPQSSTCLQRAGVYRLLATLWAEEVNSASKLLSSPQVAAEWRALGGYVPDGETELDSLAEDFCRLFIGPQGQLPPVQSVWGSGKFQSEVVSRMTEFRAIISYKSPWPELPSDHIANQLQMLSVALQLAESAVELADRDAATDIAEAFFEQHLAWSVPYMRRILDADKSGFYGSLARVSAQFLTGEQTEFLCDQPALNGRTIRE